MMMGVHVINFHSIKPGSEADELRSMFQQPPPPPPTGTLAPPPIPGAQIADLSDQAETLDGPCWWYWQAYRTWVP